MVTQLKSYLLQSAELQGMLEPQHLYTQDKLGNLKLILVFQFMFVYSDLDIFLTYCVTTNQKTFSFINFLCYCVPKQYVCRGLLKPISVHIE